MGNDELYVQTSPDNKHLLKSQCRYSQGSPKEGEENLTGRTLTAALQILSKRPKRTTDLMLENIALTTGQRDLRN